MRVAMLQKKKWMSLRKLGRSSEAVMAASGCEREVAGSIPTQCAVFSSFFSGPLSFFLHLLLSISYFYASIIIL